MAEVIDQMGHPFEPDNSVTRDTWPVIYPTLTTYIRADRLWQTYCFHTLTTSPHSPHSGLNLDSADEMFNTSFFFTYCGIISSPEEP